MLVICVKEAWTDIGYPLHYPVKGNVYTVVEERDLTGSVVNTAAGPLKWVDGHAFNLAECNTAEMTGWWKKDHFRPCKKTDIGVFQEILTKTLLQTANAQ